VVLPRRRNLNANVVGTKTRYRQMEKSKLRRVP